MPLRYTTRDVGRVLEKEDQKTGLEDVQFSLGLTLRQLKRD